MLQDLKTENPVKLVDKLDAAVEIMAKHNVDAGIIHSMREKLSRLRLMTAYIED